MRRVPRLLVKSSQNTVWKKVHFVAFHSACENCCEHQKEPVLLPKFMCIVSIFKRFICNALSAELNAIRETNVDEWHADRAVWWLHSERKVWGRRWLHALRNLAPHFCVGGFFCLTTCSRVLVCSSIPVFLLDNSRNPRCLISRAEEHSNAILMRSAHAHVNQFGEKRRIMPVIFLMQISTLLQCFGYNVPRAVILYALLSTTLSGAANPIIYGACSSSYRRLYRQFLKKCCAPCCSRSPNEIEGYPGEEGIGVQVDDAVLFAICRSAVFFCWSALFQKCCHCCCLDVWN